MLRSKYLFLALAALLLWGCGVDGDRFRLSGRLRNINQGEFLIYSLEGGTNGIDTIPVRNGRFSYETELLSPTIFILVFPNFTEQPIFAEPGEEVDVKGDASHLKEVIIKGTSDNDDMTDLRMDLNDLMPPDIPQAVIKYVEENPESGVSAYLVYRYILMDANPDYQTAYRLVTQMLAEQPDNSLLAKWRDELEALRGAGIKAKMDAFKAVDVKGRTVSQNDLRGELNVLSVWASWNFQSTDQQNRLRRLKKKYGDRLHLVSICMDADPKECRRRIERDSIEWKTVCDGLQWQGPLLAKFGIGDVPSNVIIDKKATVIERNLSPQQLEERITNELK